MGVLGLFVCKIEGCDQPFEDAAAWLEHREKDHPNRVTPTGVAVRGEGI